MGILIEGTKSNDTLTNAEANATLDAGVGNDHIENSGDGAILIGGFGNDVLENTGASVILDGGLGSDRFELNGSNQTIRYKNGDGNDMVHGWQTADTLHITDGSNYTLTTNGDDAFVKVGLGTITFKNTRDSDIFIDNTPLHGASIDGLIEGGEGNDTLIGTEDAELFIYTVGAGADVIGNGNDTMTLYQEQDAVVIIGEVELADVTFKDNRNTTTVTFAGDKKSKLTINKDAATTPITFYIGATSETALANTGLVYGELPDGVHYANEGQDYTRLTVDDTLDGEIIEATVINSQLTTIDASNAEGYVEIYGNAKNNVLKGGEGGALLNGGSGNDQLYGTSDVTAVDAFVFEMQVGGKKDVIYNYDSNDMIVVDTSKLEEGLPIFDYGVISYDGAKANFNGFNDSKNDVVLTLNKKNSLTIKNAAGKSINIYDENFELSATYGHFLPDGLKYNDKRTAIEVEDAEAANENGDIDIDLNDTLTFYSTAMNVDLSGVAVGVNIYGNKKNNVLKAGDGYALLNGGAGNDQLYGSTGEESNVDFCYVAGKDVIYDFDSDKDSFFIDSETPIDSGVLEGVTSKNFSEKGNDVILTINNKNSITFKGAVNKTIEIRDETGSINDGEGWLRYSYALPDGLTYNCKRTAIEVADSDTLIEIGAVEIDMSNKTNDEYIFAESVKKVDLSPITDEMFEAEIIGNAQDNELYAANGGCNTLYGGHQTFDNPKKAKPTADKLQGGAGEDTFIYAPYDGKDQIINYGAEDEILLDNMNDDIETIAIADKKNVVSVTLNGDKNSVFTIAKQNINTQLTFRGWANTINGEEYWFNQDYETFTYGVDSEVMTLNNSGSVLSIGGGAGDVYAYANEINSQIKTMDARQAADYVEMVGNGNANVMYAGSGGSEMDGGYNTFKNKATNDQMHGGEGADVFVYNFNDGLGGKDVVKNYVSGDDIIQLDTAPKSVTTNGKTVVLNFEERVNGKKKTGTLTINGASNITSDTAILIGIDGEYGEYKFANRLKNADWATSDGITVDNDVSIDGDYDEEHSPEDGLDADKWTKLGESSFAFADGDMAFTVSGDAVHDWAPDNSFSRGAVIAVIEEDGIPDGIAVYAEDKTIMLSDRFNRSNATFEFAEGDNAENYTWTMYRTFNNYWFTLDDTIQSELSQLAAVEDAIEMPSDFAEELFKQSKDAITFSARKRAKH